MTIQNESSSRRLEEAVRLTCSLGAEPELVVLASRTIFSGTAAALPRIPFLLPLIATLSSSAEPHRRVVAWTVPSQLSHSVAYCAHSLDKSNTGRVTVHDSSTAQCVPLWNVVRISTLSQLIQASKQLKHSSPVSKQLPGAVALSILVHKTHPFALEAMYLHSLVSTDTILGLLFQFSL